MCGPIQSQFENQVDTFLSQVLRLAMNFTLLFLTSQVETLRPKIISNGNWCALNTFHRWSALTHWTSKMSPLHPHARDVTPSKPPNAHVSTGTVMNCLVHDWSFCCLIIVAPPLCVRIRSLRLVSMQCNKIAERCQLHQEVKFCVSIALFSPSGRLLIECRLWRIQPLNCGTCIVAYVVVLTTRFRWIHCKFHRPIR